MKKKIIQWSILSLTLFAAVVFTSAYKQTRYPFPDNVKAAEQDLQTIRKRIVSDLLEPPVEAAFIKKLITTLQPDGSWPGINYKDTTKTGFQHSIHLQNMFALARAYKKNGSPYYMNAGVKRTVSSALDFWIAHDFICENWWWNEMGTPNLMINTLLVLDPDLTKQQRTAGAKIAARASLTGFGARAGGDFVPIAGMVCKQGIFKGDDSILQHAIRVMTDQVTITTARGINPDMGFHHRTDNVTSIHTYGTNYVSAFAYWAVKTAGTKYSLPDKALRLLIDYYVDGVSKCMAYGVYPDPGAKNRDLSRPGSLDAADTEIAENLARSSAYRKKELEYIIAVRQGKQKPDLTWNWHFWHSAYVADQRQNYYTSVRMFSSRQNNVEEPYNEEGLKNHHMADGSNFISRTGREYVDVFPVWDWQKIPGTTVVQRPSLPPSKEIAKKGLTAFAGAVSDGQYGAAGFDFKSVHDPLTARKAWFFFDHEYVCLGTAISSEAPYTVTTTLNQCLLSKEVVVKTASGVQTLAKGLHDLKNVSWVLHDSITYLFPSPVSLQLSNVTASGNWRSITHQAWATDSTVQKDLFTLWIDHGQKPQSEGYAYIIIPGTTAARAEQYNTNSGIQILSNTAGIQAVQNKNLQTSSIVFYQPGTIRLTPAISLTAGNPCIVMISANGNAVRKITVSDPTQLLKTVQLTLTVPFTTNNDHTRSVWNKGTKHSEIEIDLPADGYAGNSIVIETGKQ